LLKKVAITYKSGRATNYNVEMVYKKIKLTSSDLHYKAVLVVVNSYVLIQAFFLKIMRVTNVEKLIYYFYILVMILITNNFA